MRLHFLLELFLALIFIQFVFSIDFCCWESFPLISDSTISRNTSMINIFLTLLYIIFISCLLLVFGYSLSVARPVCFLHQFPIFLRLLWTTDVWISHCMKLNTPSFIYWSFYFMLMWCWRRLLRVPWTARRSNQSILKEISPGCSLKGQCWSWNSKTLATSCEVLTHWKSPWCWEGLGAGGEGDDRGWDGWMASPTWWTWVWVNSRSWWWTGRPGMLWFMGLRRVRHDWETELNWTECNRNCSYKEEYYKAYVKNFNMGFLYQSGLLCIWTQSIPPLWGFPGDSDGKESVCNAGHPGSIPGSKRPLGEWYGNPHQYSCLENSIDRGAWWAL